MKDEGGPAFPHSVEALQNGRAGLTIRDYFAAKAMQSLTAAILTSKTMTEDETKKIAQAAYEVADAMIVERNKS